MNYEVDTRNISLPFFLTNSSKNLSYGEAYKLLYSIKMFMDNMDEEIIQDMDEYGLIQFISDVGIVKMDKEDIVDHISKFIGNDAFSIMKEEDIFKIDFLEIPEYIEKISSNYTKIRINLEFLKNVVPQIWNNLIANLFSSNGLEHTHLMIFHSSVLYCYSCGKDNIEKVNFLCYDIMCFLHYNKLPAFLEKVYIHGDEIVIRYQI